jgi:hypothetical protein
VTPSTTYSLLMNSSKACNKSHLSIHLSIYVTQTCTWGHGPCTWFSFFWQFQLPDIIYMLSRLYMNRKDKTFRSKQFTDWLTLCILSQYWISLHANLKSVCWQHLSINCTTETLHVEILLPQHLNVLTSMNKLPRVMFLWYNWWTNAVNRQTSS